MQIFLLAISLMLAAIPSSSLMMVTSLLNYEKKQIALDNAAIIEGRALRGLFNDIKQANQELKTMERVHHGLHQCARTPPIQAVCVAEDLAIEAAIEILQSMIFIKASYHWHESKKKGFEEILKMGLSITNLSHQRETKLPIHSKQCFTCGLLAGWEVDYYPLKSLWFFNPVLDEVKALTEIGDSSLLETKKWNYLLSPNEYL